MGSPYAVVRRSLIELKSNQRSRAAVFVKVIHGVLHGPNLLRVLVADLDVELFFERHDQFDEIERIGVQVVDEVRFWSHLIFADAQLFGDDFLQALLSAGGHRLFLKPLSSQPVCVASTARPSTPLTNLAEVSLPNSLANSTASLMAVLRGTVALPYKDS